MLANSQERLLRLALQCYPERWRARHGDEARELATLLARDGVPLRSTTWSYFKGAARERLRAKGRRLAAGAAALAAATSLMAMSLLVSVPPSSAGAADVRAGISNRSRAAAELQVVFKAHHFDIAVEQLPVSPSLVGSILTTKALGRPTGGGAIPGLVPGTCAGGAAGCTQGLLLPSHFSGHMVVFVGRAARTGEKYARSAGIFRPGELLAGSGLLGRPVGEAIAALDRSHATVLWEGSGKKHCSTDAPDSSDQVTGGFAVSAVTVCLKAASSAPTTRSWG